MNAQTQLRAAVLLSMAAATLMLQASCARSDSADFDLNPPLISPNAINPAPLSVCIESACPAPWATCPGGELCATDTSSDIDHCGSCAPCPRPKRMLHAEAVCTGGKCAYACDALFADCNGKHTDGCEVYTGDDPLNCGGCGNVCAVGELCWRGACGCPAGFTQCGDECVDIQADNANCGSCGTKCVAPPNDSPEWKCGAGIQAPNTTWACTTGACTMQCKQSFGDCNDAFCADGCETDFTSDRLNCGACGHACGAGQDCVDGSCICPPGTTRCGNRCVDVKVDARNCGACGNRCPGPGGGTPKKAENGSPTCFSGVCGYTCFPGFADCDKRIFNGCEVNIEQDPLHCGNCTTQCDAARGQPCIGGACLTKPCEPGPGIH
jgi:hypothetical protein